MDIITSYYLEYSDCWRHLDFYNHNVSADITFGFFSCFISNTGVHAESQSETFIWAPGVVSYNSFNHEQVYFFSYSKDSLLLFR